MWPREHGAYGQLLFPLGTALAISGLEPQAVLTAIAAVAAFVAHEPLVVLLGGRGARARRDQRRRAVTWLVMSGGIAMATGIAAVASAPAHVRWLFVWPLVPATVVGGLLLRNREKSTRGEIAAATAFAAIAIPICAGAGRSPLGGFVVASTFASLFVVSTLAVRIVVLRTRGGGDPHAVQTTRIQFATAAALVAISVLLVARSGAPGGIAAFAVLPGLAVAAACAIRPPPARRLRTVGWTLLSSTAVLAVTLVAALA